MRHVGLRWVSAVACWCQIRQVSLRIGISVSDESPMRHVGLRWVSDQECRFPEGLRWVSDRSPMGLRWVSDNNNIFVNSFGNRILGFGNKILRFGDRILHFLFYAFFRNQIAQFMCQIQSVNQNKVKGYKDVRKNIIFIYKLT